MTTVTIKIKEQNKEAKALLEYLKKLPFVEIEKKEKSPYNPEFVEKIKKAEEDIKKGKTTRLNPENVWESIL